MGGFCGAISSRDVVLDVYFGTDYHSHLGTRRGGMAVYGPNGFQRSIHNIQNSWIGFIWNGIANHSSLCYFITTFAFIIIYHLPNYLSSSPILCYYRIVVNNYLIMPIKKHYYHQQ